MSNLILQSTNFFGYIKQVFFYRIYSDIESVLIINCKFIYISTVSSTQIYMHTIKLTYYFCQFIF